MNPTDKDLEWRAFVAAMVGPQRAPWGMVRARVVAAGSTSVQIANNRTGKVVMSVTVAVNQNALVAFSNTDGGTSSATAFAQAMTVGALVPFVLLPGDELFAATNSAGTVLLVSQVVF